MRDRVFVVVLPNGTFRTQRQLPKMALIGVTVDGQQLTLTAPGKNNITIDIPTFKPDLVRSCKLVFTSHNPTANANKPLLDYSLTRYNMLSQFAWLLHISCAQNIRQHCQRVVRLWRRGVRMGQWLLGGFRTTALLPPPGTYAEDNDSPAAPLPNICEVRYGRFRSVNWQMTTPRRLSAYRFFPLHPFREPITTRQHSWWSRKNP